LDWKVFNLLSYRVHEGLEVFLNLWQSFSYGLHIMTLMLSMNNTFGAYWGTITCKAIIGDKFIRMVHTWNTTTWNHRRREVWCPSVLGSISSSHMVLIHIVEWRGYLWLVEPTCVRNLALNIYISLTIIWYITISCALISLKPSWIRCGLLRHWSVLSKIVSLWLCWNPA
jgi:hypothetical protein